MLLRGIPLFYNCSIIYQLIDELRPSPVTMAQPADLATRAVIGDLTIGIIGLGYVGLPTAIGFHDAGFNVWGVDVSQRTVDMVKAGKNPTGDPDVDDIVPAPGTERWHITTSSAEAVPHCDVILVTVPTPITSDLKPDLSYVAEAGRDVFQAIRKGSRTIVVLESTVYPGVTAQTWHPIIEELGLEIGEGFGNRLLPRTVQSEETQHTAVFAKWLESLDATNPEVGKAHWLPCTRRLTTEDVRYVGKLEVAEAAKVIENVQRDINIALVNELGTYLPGVGRRCRRRPYRSSHEVELPPLHPRCWRRRPLHPR